MRPNTLGQGVAVVTPLPERVTLAASYPNPFANTTTVQFGMPQSGMVKLVVYDLQGRVVRHLVEGEVGAGWQRVSWDGRDDDGNAVASGAYVIRLAAAGRMTTRTVMMMR